MDRLEDPLVTNGVHMRKSAWDLLKARATANETSVSAEMRRILREEAEREATARGNKVAA